METLLKADLHCHSFFSDGALTPEELIDRAVAAHIDLFALTDHDTVLGVKRLKKAAQHKPIQVINGVELSVRWKLHDIHMVGLNVDINRPELTSLLELQNKKREWRARQMAELLEFTGIQSFYQKACDFAGHDRITRSHLAGVLLKEGIVSNLQVAFSRYLSRGKLAYVPTSWINIEEAVSCIVKSGGIAVIAHPYKYKLTRSKLNALIEAFKEAGGEAIEVVSGDIQVTQMGELAGLCQRFDLLASTGSDYHNDQYSRIKLGQQRRLPLQCRPIWEKWG